ncbi:hypothetical protein [Blastomonas sp. AAP53]|uniref:hypothetical protein n=1 Tax=Blastomonas sp. AAP53 TaxID=1248760 RepID=UPI00030CFD9B|nr:hypothetical protein [Blastomonas sp. AAP53]
MARVASLPRARPKNSRNGEISLPVVLTSFMLTILTVALPVANGLSDPVVTILMVIAMFSLYLTMAISMVDRRFGLLVLLFCFYHIFFLLVPGMLHAARGYFPFYSMSYPNDDIRIAMTVIAIFCVGYAIGVIVFRRGVSLAKLKIAVDKRHYSRPRMGIYALALSFLTLAIVAVNGVEMFTLRRIDSEIEYDSAAVASQLIFNFARIPSFISLCIFISLVKTRPSIATMGALVFSLATFLLVNWPASIPRYYLFGYIFTFLYVMFDFSIAIRKFGFVMSLLGGLLIVFPLINFLGRGDVRDITAFSPVEYYTESGDYDGFQSVLNVVQLVDREGASFGYQFLGVPLSPVPRSLWQDKPRPTGERAARYVGYNYTNISAPLSSEIFVDFWWWGLILFSPLLGYVSARLDMNAVQRFKQNDVWYVMMTGLLIGFETILLRGSLMSAATPIALAFLLMFFAGVIGRSGRHMPMRRR